VSRGAGRQLVTIEGTGDIAGDVGADLDIADVSAGHPTADLDGAEGGTTPAAGPASVC
jgi:hypothetical protein